MLEREAANVVPMSKAKKPMTLKTLAESDSEIRGFLKAIRDTKLRAYAVEMLDRQISAMKSN